MKKCKKCQQTNEATARFCWQCGSRLSTSLPALNIPLPRPQLQPLRHKNAVDASQIAHPDQDPQSIPVPQNQGQRLSPKLNAELKRNLQTLKKEPRPVETPKPEATEQAKVSPQSVRDAIQKIQPPAVNRENQTVRPARPGLLSQSERAVLKRTIRKREAEASQTPAVGGFALKRVEKAEEHREAVLAGRLKEQQLEEDLAFLDEMFAKPHARKQKIPVHHETSPKLPREIPIAAKTEEPVEEFSSEERRAFTTEGWLNTVKNQKQIRPSELMAYSASQQGSEFMPPLLTVATFLYFCYVLYV